ncbi:MAG: CaiB/BaiF CoA-transferase family protein [Chloroflexota bacterium]
MTSIAPHQSQDASPLAALRVLDLADEKASFCARLLADLGAEVIKVERPGGDASRWLDPFRGDTPHPERSLSFWYNNSGKLGITLDIATGPGRDIFLRLVSKADVVLETFSPGYLSELRLDYKTLSRTNPRLILASVTGFGQTGPYSLYKSGDIIAAATGGQMYVSGSPDTPPLKAYGWQPYYSASLFAAIGIMLARQEQKRSGKGQHLDISLQEAVTSTLEHVMVRYFHQKAVPARQGNRHWSDTAGLLPCRDGYIMLTFNREWETLVDLMDSEGMAADLKEDRWRETEYRRRHADHIVDVLAAWTQSHTTTELFEMGQAMRFPWAPVSSIQGVFRSPQLRERGFFTAVDHPDMGVSFDYPGSPLRLNGSPTGIRGHAPSIGEHNVEVYQERLGLTPEEIGSLAAANII